MRVCCDQDTVVSTGQQLLVRNDIFFEVDVFRWDLSIFNKDFFALVNVDNRRLQLHRGQEDL